MSQTDTNFFGSISGAKKLNIPSLKKLGANLVLNSQQKLQQESSFYFNIPNLNSFEEIASFKKYTAFPSSWYAVLTDVVGSTTAVEEGRYKDVNFVGASVIIALQNIATEHKLPFVFGGDGATLFIPSELYQATKKVLSSTQQMALQNYNLKLRCMLYPIAELYKQGMEIKVAKLRISNLYNQAMLFGNGTDFLENILKQKDSEYHIQSNLILNPNFEGLTCRWQDVQNRHGEILTLIVKAKTVENQEIVTYQKVLTEIKNIYGQPEDFNPIYAENIKLTTNFNQLGLEAKLQTFEQSNWSTLWTQFKFWIINLYGVVTEKNNQMVNLKKGQMALAADFKKFDGTLKMVISGSSAQREKLINNLDKLSIENEIVYGYYISEAATMTCLVYAEGNSEVHFVDGARGGYTLAARMLKEKIKVGLNE